MNFRDELCKACPDIPFLIIGDLNFPTINSADLTGQYSCDNNFLDLINEFYLVQSVKSITRRKKNGDGNTLDLILSSNNLIKNYNMIGGTSDHDIVRFELNLRKNLKKKICFRKQFVTIRTKTGVH